MEDHHLLTRRTAIQVGVSSAAALLSLPTQAAKNMQPDDKGKVIVAGAGAFGGWTALWLLRRGYQVTLVDPFGPGNNQSSSGGETRLIRAFYDKQIYFDMTLRSLELWKEFDRQVGHTHFHQNGLLVFNYEATTPETEAARKFYDAAGLTLEKISPDEARRRWPQLKTDDLNHVLHDPIAGYLEARRACQRVCQQFINEGGTFLQQKVHKVEMSGGKSTGLILSDGKKHEADLYVIAPGPWIIRLFPELTKPIRIVRGMCFFFSSPPGMSDLLENKLPTWMDRDHKGPFRPFGVPGCDYRGFKVGLTPPDNNDITDRFDTYDRHATAREIQWAQGVLARRFPAMAGQPLIEHRVCQYTNTPDGDFVVDRHPEAGNCWVLGGDSGHGYKLGPAIGEMMSKIVASEMKVDPMFAWSRLQGK